MRITTPPIRVASQKISSAPYRGPAYAQPNAPVLTEAQLEARAKKALAAVAAGQLIPAAYTTGGGVTDGGPGSMAAPYTNHPPPKKGSTLAHAAAAPAYGSDPYSTIIAGAPQPYSPKDIQSLIGQYTSGYTPGLTQAQIQAQAQGEVSPLVAAITQSITGQTNRAGDAIRGYSQSLADSLAALNFAAPYQTGEQAQASVDSALKASLNDAGSSDADQLASRLAVINDPSVAQAAQAVSANGAANAGTQVAQGSNALSDLIANAAAAGEYGMKQPGIAKLSGLQQLAANEQNGQNQIGSQTQQIESQLPSIIQALTGESDQNRNARASAASQALASLLGVNENRANNITTLKTNQLARNDNINAATAKNATSLQTAKIKAATAQEAAAAKGAESSVKDRLAFAKVYGYDPVTNQVIAGYKRNPDGTVSKATKGVAGKSLTPNELSSMVDTLYNGTTSSVRVKAPNPDANGNPVYRSTTKRTGQFNYQQAYQRLRALNVPDPQARQALDTVYKRGERGRAWLTNEEQSALKQSGLLPSAHRYKTLAYLDTTQAAALQAAGGLPAGEWIKQAKTKTKDLGPIYVLSEAF